MLDDRNYKDRAPLNVATLIEGEVQALADSRAGTVSRPALRRRTLEADRQTNEQTDSYAPKVGAQAAEEGAAAAERDPVDLVNHPPHYTSHPSGVECITIVEWMSFNCGNAVKYLWRSGEKGFQIQDLKKARWYVDREIARLEGMLK